VPVTASVLAMLLWNFVAMLGGFFIGARCGGRRQYVGADVRIARAKGVIGDW
jgi:hypothetical protein